MSKNSPQVDLLKNIVEKGKSQKPKKKLFYWGKFFIYLLIIFILGAGFFIYRIISSSSKIIENYSPTSLAQQIKYLVLSPEKDLKGETEDRVNILLLGMGGEGHSGAYLTDTIIVASLKPSTQEVAFLSIPRDLFVPIPGYGWRKINYANAFGRLKNLPGGGETLTQEVVENITGLTIHYYARVDFEGFRKIIDDLGGINIEVERSFTDYMYPTYDFGYQTVSFKQGEQIFNGEQALRFVRSRHGNNNEGSDFARSRRQQKVLSALKDKIFSFNTFLNPNKIINVFDTLGEHSQTNLQPWEIIKISNIVKEINEEDIINLVLDSSPGSPLHAETTIDGAYILRPNAGPDNFTEIERLATNIFSLGFIVKEEAKIEIQNGTNINGLGQSIADTLKSANFNVTKVANASDKNYKKTIIYDLTAGQKPYTLAALKEWLGAQVSSIVPAFYDGQAAAYTLPELDIVPEINSNFDDEINVEEKPDILIILGDNTTSVDKNINASLGRSSSLNTTKPTL